MRHESHNGASVVGVQFLLANLDKESVSRDRQGGCQGDSSCKSWTHAWFLPILFSLLTTSRCHHHCHRRRHHHHQRHHHHHRHCHHHHRRHHRHHHHHDPLLISLFVINISIFFIFQTLINRSALS